MSDRVGHVRRRHHLARHLAIAGAFAVFASACTSGSRPEAAPTHQPAGGTLRVGMLLTGDGSVVYCEFTFCGGQHDDPQWAGGDPPVDEVARCCLLRTLLSYNGEPTGRGGAVVRPDLARSFPTISPDGLSWTFHLKPGIHYAPPLQDREIIAQDFVRSIERLLGPPPPDGPDYYSGVLDPYLGRFLDLAGAIVGGRAYVDGSADHITGLEAPDRATLRIHLTRPNGALASMLTEPDTAPIPPNPFDPAARAGVAEGHPRTYFRYLVASGPYMIEGAPQLDFSKQPDLQPAASGDAPGSLTLVRNPSWDRRTDQLRAAEPDRIVLTPVASAADAEELVRNGALDLVMNWDAGPELLGPHAAGDGTRAFLTTMDAIHWITLNTAVPPFDDLHVRRAINDVIDRRAIAAGYARAGIGVRPATHFGLDSEENNLLLNFDPAGASGGDLVAARKEMAQSRYDRDQDGTCDAPACNGIRMLANDRPGRAAIAHQIAVQLGAIGIRVRAVVQDGDTFISSYQRPELHIPMRIDVWLKDLTSGSTYFPPLLARVGAGASSAFDESLVGASAAELKRWGYTVTSVPNIDDRVAACLPLAFGAQTRCWANLDAYLMGQVVSKVPLVTLTTGRVVSSRVTRFSFDQSSAEPMPSLDRVVLKGDAATPSPTPSMSVPTIPEGTYRFTIAKADLLRFDPKSDPEGIDENTGTVTITLRDGWWIWVWNADHPIDNPIAVGTYSGSGDHVVFETTQPNFNALTTPEIRWTFDGHALRLTFIGCGNLNELDPGAPHLCDDIRVPYEAHPWEKIG